MSYGGLVITVSGPDGSGKSTITELLGARLDELGVEHEILWTRLGYTPGFEGLKTLARRILGGRIPQQGETRKRDQVMQQGGVKNVWLFCAAADLLVTYAVRVRTSSGRGRVTTCDRHIWDALIDRQMYYPASGWVDVLIQNGYRMFGRQPDCSILLQVPLEVAKARSEGKDEPFPDPPELREKRHSAYEALGKGKELTVLDATQPPDAIVSEIIASLPLQ